VDRPISPAESLNTILKKQIKNKKDENSHEKKAKNSDVKKVDLTLSIVDS